MKIVLDDFFIIQKIIIVGNGIFCLLNNNIFDFQKLNNGLMVVQVKYSFFYKNINNWMTKLIGFFFNLNPTHALWNSIWIQHKLSEIWNYYCTLAFLMLAFLHFYLFFQWWMIMYLDPYTLEIKYKYLIINTPAFPY